MFETVCILSSVAALAAAYCVYKLAMFASEIADMIEMRDE